MAGNKHTSTHCTKFSTLFECCISKGKKNKCMETFTSAMLLNVSPFMAVGLGLCCSRGLLVGRDQDVFISMD